MRTIHKKSDLLSFLQDYDERLKIGFVPTMGCLHKGHISLIERSLKETDHTICSIFVNPRQFNDKNDLEKYPRTLENDLDLLYVSGCNTVFCPVADDLYDTSFKPNNFNLNGLDNYMEGSSRPGHFKGMLDVVNLFFEIINPTKAYFGEKDFQQLAIVKHLANQKFPNIEVIGCPIYREPNGLAMSSRNIRLTQTARKNAGFIYKIISTAVSMKPKFTPKEIADFVIGEFSLKQEYILDYYEIVDSLTLAPVHEWKDSKQPHSCIAVWLEGVRLIDNCGF